MGLLIWANPTRGLLIWANGIVFLLSVIGIFHIEFVQITIEDFKLTIFFSKEILENLLGLYRAFQDIVCISQESVIYCLVGM